MRAFSFMLRGRPRGAIVESERAVMISSCCDLFFISTLICKNGVKVDRKLKT